MIIKKPGKHSPAFALQVAFILIPLMEAEVQLG